MCVLNLLMGKINNLAKKLRISLIIFPVKKNKTWNNYIKEYSEIKYNEKKNSKLSIDMF